MPKLDHNVQLFAASVGGIASPGAVLDRLGNIVNPAGLRPLAVWFLPRTLTGAQWPWEDGETLFVDRHAPQDFYVEYRKGFEGNGGTSFTAKKARQISAPFTLVEAEKEARSQRAVNPWIFKLLRAHGIRDGLYCSFRRWQCCLYSAELLALSPGDRVLISTAAWLAVGRIEQLAMPPRKTKLKLLVPLTPRECECLQQLATYGDQAAAAAAIGITVNSMDVHLRAVRKKLGVKSTAQALLTAYKYGLISY